MGSKAVAAVVAVLILIGAGIAVAKHDNNKNSSNVTSPSQSRYGSTNNPSTNQSTTPAEIIQTKTDAKVGQYLADGNGKTLYTYNLDTSGKSNCTGSCLANWPAYTAASTGANLPTNVATIVRSDDHSVQYTYKGMPLYFFTSDQIGQVTGDGVENFKVAKP